MGNLVAICRNIDSVGARNNEQYKPKKGKRLKPGAPVLGEALSAIDRSSLGRLERYFAFLSTV